MSRKKSDSTMLQMVSEMYGDALYEYCPLGEYLVAARGGVRWTPDVEIYTDGCALGDRLLKAWPNG